MDLMAMSHFAPNQPWGELSSVYQKGEGEERGEGGGGDQAREG